VVADPMKKPITLPARTPQVAAGAEDPAVRLCDPASGGFTHVLAGHRGAVWALAWSRTSEWHLATGAADGQVGPRRGLGSAGARARVVRLAARAAGGQSAPLSQAALLSGVLVMRARMLACLRASPGRGRPPLARRDNTRQALPVVCPRLRVSMLESLPQARARFTRAVQRNAVEQGARARLGDRVHGLRAGLSAPGAGPQVRLWDIRTSGCVRVFDQHSTSAASSRCAPPPP